MEEQSKLTWEATDVHIQRILLHFNSTGSSWNLCWWSFGTERAVESFPLVHECNHRTIVHVDG